MTNVRKRPREPMMDGSDSINDQKHLKFSSEPQAIADNQQPQLSGSLRLNYTALQSASFFSHRTSSIESCESPSLNGLGNSINDLQTNDKDDITGVGAESDESTLETNDRSAFAGGGEVMSSNSQQRACENETVPSTLMRPEYQSTPVRNNGCYMSNVTLTSERRNSESGEDSAEEDRNVENEAGGDLAIFHPGDLITPIIGFETMVSRSKFTVYKIHVQRKVSDESPSSWFVFRRYSDFVYVNNRLKYLFPNFRLSLPPKRWFRDNFDTNFLEDRLLGLQAFLDNITGHKDLCNSEAVRAFFCTDEPPGPHDSLEESRALCESLEESMYSVKQDLQEKETELALLKEELELYKSQVQLLTNQLKVMNSRSPSTEVTSPSSTGTGYSAADCDRLTPPSPVIAEQTKHQS